MAKPVCFSAEALEGRHARVERFKIKATLFDTGISYRQFSNINCSLNFISQDAMLWFKRSPRFKQLSAEEDSESLISDTQETKDYAEPPGYCPVARPWHLLFFVLLTAALTYLYSLFTGGWSINARNQWLDHISNYSPLLEDFRIEYSTVRFNGSLLHENIYRQPASPAVDQAWEDLGVDYRAAIVPPHLAAKSGLLESQVQVSDKYGGGYPANVEGLHHLHCLNLLRQSLYFNYEYYRSKSEGAFINSEDILRFHVTHCLDILRQQLICTVDIGVLGQVWWNKESPSAYPDFDTEHKCRNFDAVRRWAFEHQAPEVVPDDYLSPPRGEWEVYESLP
ncbi:uncharacterized protein LY89DRAFT_780934 [Mollisia scopiformis]|uniref:Tat pathway signal sequence n=1 Tax=Mollisia scopiformis TaxID=149040 RepID=A0A194XGS0_MOLSC|nr:uncharacterized protein LY89DRAFT_780934 [Mollisia scopiformis]KUJ18967.1 hypothetical protein LY89DRAFT_780934 [Mollisia scopiformis]